MIEYIFNKLGYVKKSKVTEQLNFARSVGEIVEAIDNETKLFKESPWHIDHMSTQDDYLMRLYYLVHDEYPSDIGVIQNSSSHIKLQATGEYVRSRPKVLNKCRLPEHPDFNEYRENI